MRKEKGITLIALTITIIILIILASITTYSGISTIKSSKLNKFKQELEIMQSQVNVLYEKYNTEIEAGQEIEIGEELMNSEEENNAFSGANETDKTGYKKFTKQTLEELGIEGIEREYLVNIAKRKVISLEPFEQDRKVYYTLAQLSDKNTIEEGIDRGEIEFTLETSLSQTGLEVRISDIHYSKYVGKGDILYQKVGSSTWKTLVTDYKESEYQFILSEPGEYSVKIVDAAGVEKIADTPIIIETGNYLLDGTRYFDTLVEAVAAAQDGSIIQVVKDTEETESVTIDKSITLDTNRKTITFTEGGESRIRINEGKDIVINGNGTISGEIVNCSLIINEGNLKINNTTIDSPAGGAVFSTIYNFSNATVISNNSNVSNITGYEDAEIIINGGEYGEVSGAGGGLGIVIINSGTINYLDLLRGGKSITINSGKIGTISVGDNSGNIDLTIGNINKNLNDNNPQINNIELNSPDLVVITAIINFYNGIIKNCDINIEDALLGRNDHGYVGTYNIRPGYKAQKTEEGIILVKE